MTPLHTPARTCHLWEYKVVLILMFQELPKCLRNSHKEWYLAVSAQASADPPGPMRTPSPSQLRCNTVSMHDKDPGPYLRRPASVCEQAPRPGRHQMHSFCKCWLCQSSREALYIFSGRDLYSTCETIQRSGGAGCKANLPCALGCSSLPLPLRNRNRAGPQVPHGTSECSTKTDFPVKAPGVAAS